MDLSWDPVSEIVRITRLCVVPKLVRDYNEAEDHAEYHDKQNKLSKYSAQIENIIIENELQELEGFCSRILPSLIVLYLQRSSDNPWNSSEHAQKLNTIFRKKFSVDLDSVLIRDDLFNVQEVFEGTLQELNKRFPSDDLKKYPAVIDVYCKLVGRIQEYKVSHNPVAVFPISLMLIDDYIISNKVRGLKCCLAILQCLNEKHFADGNYYDVIYSSLKKTLSEKDLDVTKLVLECLQNFINIVPEEIKKSKRYETFAVMLEQLHFESNLYRKTIYFISIKNMLSTHRLDCGSTKLMKTVLCDNIHVCCNDAVADILLVDVLECLQVWLTHCWCIWQLSSDHKLLSALIKLLYVSRKENIASVIQDLITTMIALCSKDERALILENLEKSQIQSIDFKEKLDEIKREIEL